jgi:hypothetical protein
METEVIANVLGGRKVLESTVRKPDDLAKLVRMGLPATSITMLVCHNPTRHIYRDERITIYVRVRSDHCRFVLANTAGQRLFFGEEGHTAYRDRRDRNDHKH